MAADVRCHLFDAGAVTGPSVVDGVHLDAEQHACLGRKRAAVVGTFLGEGHA